MADKIGNEVKTHRENGAKNNKRSRFAKFLLRFFESMYVYGSKFSDKKNFDIADCF